MTPTPEDMELLAYEYVLGTLDADERAEAARRRAAEPDFDALVTAWEARLAPMLDDVAPVMPPRSVLTGLRAALDGGEAPSAGARPGPRLAQDDGRPASRLGAAPRRPLAAPVVEPRPDRQSNVVVLRRSVARWRAVAMAASIVAAGAIGVLVYRPDLVRPPAPDQRYVAVFGQQDLQPSFVMSIDLKTRELTIRPVTAGPEADKSYQLWIVSDTLGPQPQSLGLLEGVESPTRRELQMQNLTPAALRNATFGISLEPKGGSPTGLPTGPALHGRLIPTSTEK